MIARILALVARPAELTAARAELRQTHKALSTEQMTTAGLTSEVKELTRRLATARLAADAAEGETALLRANRTYVTAARCECGGDTVEFWRLRAAAAERQAAQDRINAVALTDEIDRLRPLAEEAERLQHIRQLGRDGIAVVS